MAEVQAPVSEPAKEVPPRSSIAFTSTTMAPNYSFIDTVIRVLLFSASLVAVVVMVTAKQTEMVPLPGIPVLVPREAKFDHSPAFIYFVAALSVSGLYSILTTIVSISVILKPVYSKKFSLLFAFGDAIMLGIVAAATGTAGGVAYVGLKGNSHTGWNEICNTYDKFCRHVGSSIAVSLVASILLVLLIMLSTFSLYKRCPE